MMQLVDQFYEALPRTLSGWRDGSYQETVRRLQVGNLGSLGTRLLYARLGVLEPDSSFLERALERVPKVGRMMGEEYASAGATFIRQRVLSYEEHVFRVPGREASLRGDGVHENGRAAPTLWLTPVQPPGCPFADRGTCSEFRMLTGFCEALAREAPAAAGDAEGRRGFG